MIATSPEPERPGAHPQSAASVSPAIRSTSLWHRPEDFGAEYLLINIFVLSCRIRRLGAISRPSIARANNVHANPLLPVGSFVRTSRAVRF